MAEASGAKVGVNALGRARRDREAAMPMNYASAAKGHLAKKGRGVAGVANLAGAMKSVGGSPKRKPFSSKERIQVSAPITTPPRFDVDTIDLTAPNSLPVVGGVVVIGALT